MKDDDIKNMLRAAGIPREAFYMTLTKLGRIDVKEWAASVEEGGFAYITGFHTNSNKALTAYDDAERLFYLTAKELALLGHHVCCCDLIDLHNAWVKQEAEDERYTRLANADTLCIRNFFEPTAPLFPPYDYHYIASRLTGRHRDGTTLVLLGMRTASGPGSSIGDWWPPSFNSYTNRKATVMVAST